MAEMTIPEAAAAMRISVDTVRRRIRRGELVSHRDQQGRYVVTVDDTAVAAPVQPAAVRDLQRELEHAREMLEEREQLTQRELERVQALLAERERLVAEVSRARDDAVASLEAERAGRAKAEAEREQAHSRITALDERVVALLERQQELTAGALVNAQQAREGTVVDVTSPMQVKGESQGDRRRFLRWRK